jgi:ABC-type multidrug transport system fused ATPase/permease subunit
MLGLYQIESGQILVNGYPISDYDTKDVRKMFSALFQNFVQYPLSLRDNVSLSDLGKRFDDGEIIEALKQSGIYEDYDKFENGIESYMTRQFDDNGIELSKGQWQKIALSRAYFKNAEIIIFDEPSAALDAEAEDRIFRNFEDISENKTAIMISHRISSAKMSNKVIVLDDGKIIESGTHEELAEFNGLYAKLYNLQMEKYGIKESQEKEAEQP